MAKNQMRDTTDTVVSEGVKSAAIGSACPHCHKGVVEADGDPDYRWCPQCGWDDYPRCDHGIIEWEFCVKCPDGGV